MDRVEYQPLIIQDILNLYKREELNLRPWYQRKVVWTQLQQSYLINTIHERMPIPSIYVRHSIDLNSGKSVREVVDGQQRLWSVIQYAGDAFAARHPKYEKPVRFSQLTKAEKHQFLTTSLAVGYLLGADDGAVIEIFGRINSVAKKLSPQETRNAKYSGEFKHFCVRQAASRVNFWRTRNIFTALEIARMVEMQFIAELVMNLLEGLQDYSPKRIDTFYADNEKTFSKQTSITKRLDDVFEILASLSESSIKDTIFRRPPLFFSLFLIVDELKSSIDTWEIEAAIASVDAAFHAQKKTKADNEFYIACRSNPHCIRAYPRS